MQAARPLPWTPYALILVLFVGPGSALTPLGTAGPRSLRLPVWLSQANLAPRAAVVTMVPSPGSSQCKPGGELF